jgi:hypothetical protein
MMPAPGFVLFENLLCALGFGVLACILRTNPNVVRQGYSEEYQGDKLQHVYFDVLSPPKRAFLSLHLMSLELLTGVSLSSVRLFCHTDRNAYVCDSQIVTMASDCAVRLGRMGPPTPLVLKRTHGLLWIICIPIVILILTCSFLKQSV